MLKERTTILEQLNKNWGWFLIFGISLVLLGTAAVYFAYFSTLFSVMYLGTLLVVLGLFESFHSFKIRTLSRFLLHLFLGILYGLGGLFIIIHPSISAINLTLLLALFFITSGILKTLFSCASKLPHCGLLTLNGVLSIILGILIWQQWPSSGLWVIGMFLGIDAIFAGWNWIMLALTAKNLKIDITQTKPQE